MAHGMNVTKAKGADGRGRLAQPWPRPTDPAATTPRLDSPSRRDTDRKAARADATAGSGRRGRDRRERTQRGGGAGRGTRHAAGGGGQGRARARTQAAPHAGTPPPRARGEGWATEKRPHGYLCIGF